MEYTNECIRLELLCSALFRLDRHPSICFQVNTLQKGHFFSPCVSISMSPYPSGGGHFFVQIHPIGVGIGMTLSFLHNNF